MMHHFIGEFSDRFAHLVADLISEDAAAAAQQAHALKGSALTLGLDALGVALGDIDEQLRRHDLASALQGIGAVEIAWEQVQKEWSALAGGTP